MKDDDIGTGSPCQQAAIHRHPIEDKPVQRYIANKHNTLRCKKRRNFDIDGCKKIFSSKKRQFTVHSYKKEREKSNAA